jgi:hypothetical protein
MTALPPKADIVHGGGNVCFVAKADIRRPFPVPFESTRGELEFGDCSTSKIDAVVSLGMPGSITISRKACHESLHADDQVRTDRRSDESRLHT